MADLSGDKDPDILKKAGSHMGEAERFVKRGKLNMAMGHGSKHKAP